MTEFKGSKTEANLLAAFSGESQARNKYNYYASQAKKEGYEQISALFLKTAENEKEHAKLWLKELKGIGSTAENLAAALGIDEAQTARLSFTQEFAAVFFIPQRDKAPVQRAESGTQILVFQHAVGVFPVRPAGGME